MSDLKQRLLKFEAAHGLLMVIAAIVGLLVTFWHLEYVLHALAVLLFGITFFWGLYKIFYNPVKKEALKVIAREKYIAEKINKL